MENNEDKNVLFDEGIEKLFVQKIKDLRHGENLHQKAALYKSEKNLDYEVLDGKELSYNNFLDLDVALSIACEFYDVNAVAFVKHAIPCGVALGKDIEEAYMKAFDCDPISSFGAVVAFSQSVTAKIAKHAAELALDILIAPDFTPEALDILSKKDDLKLVRLKTPLRMYNSILSREVKITPFGALVQQPDQKQLDKDTFSVLTKTKPDAQMIENMVFAWKVVKHSRTNAIVIAKDFKTLAVCAGQTAEIDAMEIALNKACDGAKDAVAASDNCISSIEVVQAAAQCRIVGIIQPGGSIKDNDVAALADKYNIVVISTGIRHFKH